jgi:uncharacterized OB-fold protein
LQNTKKKKRGKENSVLAMEKEMKKQCVSCGRIYI